MSCGTWAGTVACVALVGFGGAPGEDVPAQNQAPAGVASPAQAKPSDPLAALYAESLDSDAKETILRVIAESGGERGHQLLLKVARQDQDPEIRETAIRHLAERGNTPLLLQLFDAEQDEDVKETILRHLAERDDEASRKKIDEIARSNSDSDLRETAIRHIAERGRTPELLALFDAEKDPDIRETILRHLAERDDEEGRKKLLSVARADADPDLRETAIRHLAERRQIAALIEIFDAEKDAEVKETLVRHLAESGDAKATEKLLSIARSDSDRDVRDAALRAVAERAARQ